MMLVLLLAVGLAIAARPLWEPRAPQGTLVEVSGDVPNPGLHVLEVPTVERAVAAAGGDPAGQAATRLHDGDHIIVSGTGVRIAPASNPLLVGLPVDINHSDVTGLAALPGIGPKTAAAIVDDRQSNGPFRSVGELERVRGIGAETVEALRPYLTLGDLR